MNNLSRYILVFFFCLMSALPMAAQTKAINAQKERKAQLEKEIEQIDRQLKENANQSASAVTRITLTRKKIENRKELIAQADERIGSLRKDINGQTAKLRKLQAKLDTLTAHYERLIIGAYKVRDSRKWFMLILTSKDLAQGYRRYSYLRELSAQMNQQAIEIEELSIAVKAERDQLRKLKGQAEQARKEREKEVKSLQADEAAEAQQIDQLNKQRKKYEKELAQKRKQVAALKREIERLIKEALEQDKKAKGKGKSGKRASTAIDTKLEAEFASNKGKLPWPADGPIVEKYGKQYHPVYKSVELPFNDGVSIGVPIGTQAKCVFNGVVRKIIVMPGYNQCVLVQHGSYFTFYCRLKSVCVKAGDKVVTGQNLGTVDTIGGTTSIHFEVWKGTTTLNPESWLQ